MSPYPQELTAEDCWQRLATQQVGRVVFDTPDGPQIYPVNFEVIDKTIVFRTAAYGQLAAHAHEGDVTFEVDELDPELHRGWSVIAVGRARMLQGEELRDVTHRQTLESWAAGTRSLHIRIAPRSLSGREVQRERQAGPHPSDDASVHGPRLRLASAVMFVQDLGASVDFYQELLGWDVTLQDNTVALLVGPYGTQFYLREKGARAQHPLGPVGIQYLIWTADGTEDLHRCEQVLRRFDAHVTTMTDDGFTVVEGRGPNDVPILVTYPGPGQAQRHRILQRVYAW